MDRRIELHDLLKSLGTPNVYFQTPSNVSMKYPCIIYKRDSTDTVFADNTPYKHTRKYQVTFISRDIDDPIVDAISNLPLCKHASNFVTDGLIHDVFNLYF